MERRGERNGKSNGVTEHNKRENGGRREERKEGRKEGKKEDGTGSAQFQQRGGLLVLINFAKIFPTFARVQPLGRT